MKATFCDVCGKQVESEYFAFELELESPKLYPVGTSDWRYIDLCEDCGLQVREILDNCLMNKRMPIKIVFEGEERTGTSGD